MIIKVTKQDIAKGLRGDSGKCPVARALKRAGFKSVRAGLYSLQADNRKPLPTMEPVFTFMQNFDSGGTPDPFSFEIAWRKPAAKKTAVAKTRKKAAKR